MTRSVHDILNDMRSADIQTRARASRELADRHADCGEHVKSISQFLHVDNDAIADMASVTLGRIGPQIVDVLMDDLPNTVGKVRSRYISLILWHCDVVTMNRICNAELDCNDDQRRFHAANCVGRRLADASTMGSDERAILIRAVKLLVTARSVEHRDQYWSQARFTLRDLGLLTRNRG